MAILDRPRDRRLVVIVGLLPDLDGIFILFDSQLYLTYHHTFGHSFLLGLPMVVLVTALSTSRLRTAVASFGAFSLHLLTDIIGSNWPVHPLYPFGPSFTIAGLAPDSLVYGVINPITAMLLLIATAAVLISREVSPFEVVSERLDRIVVRLYVYPLKYECATCRKRATGRCTSCRRMRCSRHQLLFRSTCTECAASGRTP